MDLISVVLYVFVVLLGVALVATVSAWIVMLLAKAVLAVAHRAVRARYNQNRPW